MKRLLARTIVKISARAWIHILRGAASWWKTAVHFAWVRKTRSTRFSTWSVTSKSGRSYHWPSCMHPACSIQMKSPCVGSYIPAVSSASKQCLTLAKLQYLLARFHQVLASAIKTLQCGCANAALTICAPSIQRCLHSPLRIPCFWADIIVYSERPHWQRECWPARRGFPCASFSSEEVLMMKCTREQQATQCSYHSLLSKLRASAAKHCCPPGRTGGLVLQIDR